MGDVVPFLIALIAAVILTPIAAAAGVRLGVLDRPGSLKIHQRPTPTTGGFAVIGAVVIAVWAFGGLDPWVVAALGLAFAGGLIDDLHPSPPWVRLVVQIGAGGLLVAGGLRLESLAGFGAVAIVLATVATCNAVNMLDGQDGLAAGLAGIASIGMALVAITLGVAADLPLASAGALLGFLVWNRPPARVFLGDSGAYAVGVLLVVIAAQASTTGWNALLAVGTCLGVFVYEIGSTVFRRLRSSASATQGDRGHTYDRIGAKIGSRNGATAAMWGCGVVAAALGVAIVHVSTALAVLLIASALTIVAVLDARIVGASISKGEG